MVAIKHLPALKGEASICDLNLETASITPLALYTIPPINAPTPKTATEQTPPTTLPTTISTAIAIAVTLLIIGIAIRYLVKKR
jgi:hypothetical protein